MSDLISRKAAIDALYDWERSYTWDEHCIEDYDAKYIVSPSNIIEQLPSAEPERPTGYMHLLDECANAGYYCSKCQKKVVREGWSKTVKKIKFCPNCGAKMEVEHD